MVGPNNRKTYLKCNFLDLDNLRVRFREIMPRLPYDSRGIEYFNIPKFTLTTGQQIDIRVAYRCFNPKASQIACIPTCYGGRINTTLNFTNQDQVFANYRVIVVAMLGNGESSSPSNTPDFPSSLDYRDCIHAQYQLLTQHLGIKQLDVVLGFSMGGQQAYHWACMYPDFMKNAIVTCGSAKTSGLNYTFLEGPKTALTKSVDYADGEYKTKGITPVKGLRAFGRAYCAWLMSGDWFRERLWHKALGYRSIADWIADGPETMVADWDPEDVLILVRMWQAGDIGTTRDDGDYTKALESIKAKVLLMPSRTDQYFQVADSEVEMKYLKNAQLAPIETVWGHVAGGGGNEADTEWMSQRIKKFLGEVV